MTCLPANAAQLTWCSAPVSVLKLAGVFELVYCRKSVAVYNVMLPLSCRAEAASKGGHWQNGKR